MARLLELMLTRFRNYEYRKVSFEGRVTGICGLNGVGKTNLLDAVYMLCFTRSYFSRTDASSVRSGFDGFRVEGKWDEAGLPLSTACILREGGRKEFKVNGEACTRFSAHIGRLPVVFVAPDDTQIVTGGSEERRRYIDALISQIDPGYLQQLIRYNRILQERNGFLRRMAEQGSGSLSLLDVLDGQLSEAGTRIHASRASYLGKCLSHIQGFYATISGGGESPEIRYSSQLADRPLDMLLREGRSKDLASQRTGSGVHRDDLEFLLQGEPFRHAGSQGQRKSLLFALKLAEFEMLREAKGASPLLLLDDVFEKLDARRMENLLEWVGSHTDGQVLLTDTHEERMREALGRTGTDHGIVSL